MNIPSKAIAFFWQRVAKSASCWLWIGATTPNGYGMVYVAYLGKDNGKRKQWSMNAHRFSWLIHRGDIPPDRYVLHKCDVRICVNPDHLEIGTATKNMQDALARGRMCIGTRQAKAKLTEANVLEARRLFFSRAMTGKALAAKYGVTPATMHLALHGFTWKHVKENA